MAGAAITIDEKTQIRTNAIFTPAGSSTAFDPTGVKLITRAPGAVGVTTYIFGQPGSPIVRSLAGVYHAYLTLNTPGAWWITWQGEGNTGPIVVGEIMVRVRNAVNV
jgi:hypothetical protein